MTKLEALKKIEELEEYVKNHTRHPLTYAKGQIYQRKNGNVFILDANLDLVCIQGDRPGNFWLEGKGFDGNESTFDYLGTANDIVEIKQ